MYIIFITFYIYIFYKIFNYYKICKNIICKNININVKNLINLLNVKCLKSITHNAINNLLLLQKVRKIIILYIFYNY